MRLCVHVRVRSHQASLSRSHNRKGCAHESKRQLFPFVFNPQLFDGKKTRSWNRNTSVFPFQQLLAVL